MGRHNNCFKNSGHCSHTQKKNTVHFKYALSVSIIYLNDSQNQKIKKTARKMITIGFLIIVIELCN